MREHASAFRNGALVRGDGALAHGDGVVAHGDGAAPGEDARAGGNGVAAPGGGALVHGNGAEPGGGALAGANGMERGAEGIPPREPVAPRSDGFADPMPNRAPTFAVRWAPPLLVAGVLFGCSPGFEPPSKVQTLRVLAVRPEPASGSPGGTVSLDMLVADGKTEPDEPARPLEIVWLLGCHNPASRLYYGCIPALRAVAAGIDSPGSVPPGALVLGTHATLAIPEDILSSAPRVASDPVHFGVSYAYFAVCAGRLEPRPEYVDRIPLACVDPQTGGALGPSDFVVGFATVYTYEGGSNDNPELTSVEFNGSEVPDPTCVDDPSCLPTVPPCTLEERDQCPVYHVSPHVSAASAEPVAGGGTEVLWASYYATSGSFSAPTQLVNDHATGFLADYSGSFRASADPVGPVRFWVTINDQRGGATWSTFDVLVQ